MTSAHEGLSREDRPLGYGSLLVAAGVFAVLLAPLPLAVIAGLALEAAWLDQAKMGILVGSLISGLLGWVILRAGRDTAASGTRPEGR